MDEILFLIFGAISFVFAIIKTFELSLETDFLKPLEKDINFENPEMVTKKKTEFLVLLVIFWAVGCSGFIHYFFLTLPKETALENIMWTLSISISSLAVIYWISSFDMRKNKKVDDLEKEVDDIGKN